jgi:hypothetical protein
MSTPGPRGVNPGGLMKRPGTARAAPHPRGVNPGGPNKPAKPALRGAPAPRGVNPGGPMKPGPALRKRPAKRRGLAGPATGGGWVLGGNDMHDTCAAAAIANSLLLATEIRAADEEIIAFGEGLDLEDALGMAAERGLAGVRLARFGPAGFGETWAGLILGIDLPGPHAVLTLGDDWVTWGRRCAMGAFPGAVVEEAWEVRWAV